MHTGYRAILRLLHSRSCRRGRNILRPFDVIYTYSSTFPGRIDVYKMPRRSTGHPISRLGIGVHRLRTHSAPLLPLIESYPSTLDSIRYQLISGMIYNEHSSRLNLYPGDEGRVSTGAHHHVSLGYLSNQSHHELVHSDIHRIPFLHHTYLMLKDL